MPEPRSRIGGQRRDTMCAVNRWMEHSGGYVMMGCTDGHGVSLRDRRAVALLVLLAAGILGCSAACASADRDAFAITHGPLLQTPGPTEMTVTWHTNRAGVSRVLYGAGDELDQTAVASHAGLIPNDTTCHVVRIEGLAPGATYRYKVVTQEFKGYVSPYAVAYGDTAESGTHSFTTLDPGKASFSFLMWNDIHDDSRRLEAMFDDVSWDGVDFVVFNGDMINDFKRPEQVFRGFYDASVNRFGRTIPLVFTRGNHETRGPLARRLADYFPGRDGRFYWSFAHGPAHFVVLDSGEDKPDDHKEYAGLTDFGPYRNEQTAWLRAGLAGESARGAAYRVVLTHQPSGYGTFDHFGVQEIRRLWDPIINEAGCQLWLSGHMHKFLLREPRQSGDNAYHAIINPQDGTVRVDVTPEALQVTIIRKGGEVLASIRIPAARE
jgi:predicted phosphodiesterase